ncbi:hypothetical protein SADUNF_Sadunf06G0157800 [Salix dunnii]|uniref:Glutaredoxin domain-containing protein n=1 Tax=Salix dunnii TaxID=1413687 RepID=A0A835K517_9ROSI|nr:hypothetical protein SADUNF_Sadunf06G0157800 [Salix dunnii]
MKSMKGRFLKKLNFIPSIGSLKQGLVYHLNSTENLSYQNLQVPPIYIQEDHKKGILAGNFGVSKHTTESKDEELDLELNFVDKVNIATSVVPNDRVPAMDSPEAPVSTKITVEQATENEDGKEIEEYPYLSDFKEKCLPGGSQSVILYTTGLRSIRKTFEDCHAIRFLLESLKVTFCERDVSLHLEFREELWRILGGRVIPPRLFIRGRYIGGADEVIGLHEQGRLKKLLAVVRSLKKIRMMRSALDALNVMKTDWLSAPSAAESPALVLKLFVGAVMFSILPVVDFMLSVKLNGEMGAIKLHTESSRWQGTELVLGLRRLEGSTATSQDSETLLGPEVKQVKALGKIIQIHTVLQLFSMKVACSCLAKRNNPNDAHWKAKGGNFSLDGYLEKKTNMHFKESFHVLEYHQSCKVPLYCLHGTGKGNIWFQSISRKVPKS